MRRASPCLRHRCRCRGLVLMALLLFPLLSLCACLCGQCVSGSGVQSDVNSLLDVQSTVADLDTFVGMLETQAALEDATDAHLSEPELALLEVGAQDNPSYTLAYPAVTYAAQAAGGFFHPFSNVNPLAAPWSGFAPVAAPVAPLSAAAIANSPLSYYASALGGAPAVAYGAAALNPLALGLGGVAGAFPAGPLKGGYNVHGLVPQGADGLYHAGLNADLTSLGGHATDGGADAGADAGAADAGADGADAAGFLEAGNEPEQMEANAAEVAYGLFPAPTPHSPHYARDGMASLGVHSLQIEEVGSNEVDQDFPAMVEVEHYVDNLEEEMNPKAEAEDEE